MGLLLGFLFCSIDPEVCFSASTTFVLMTVALQYCLNSGEGYASQFILYSGFLWQY